MKNKKWSEQTENQSQESSSLIIHHPSLITQRCNKTLHVLDTTILCKYRVMTLRIPSKTRVFYTMLVQRPVIVFVWKPSFSTQSPAPMITQGMPLMPEHNRRSFPRIQPHSKLLIWIDSKEQQRSSLLLDICGFYLIVVRSQLHLPGSYWNQMNRLYIIGVVLFAMMIRSTSAVVMFASTGSIQQEGNAMADIARAIPGLTTLSGMVWYTLRAYSMPNLWSLISMMWFDTMRYMRWYY